VAVVAVDQAFTESALVQEAAVVAVDQAFTSGLRKTVLYAVYHLQKESRRSRRSKHLSDRKSGPQFPNIRIKTLAEAGAKRTLRRQMKSRAEASIKTLAEAGAKRTLRRQMKSRAEASAQRAPGQQMKTPLDKLSLN
jgi:hypothetical protein